MTMLTMMVLTSLCQDQLGMLILLGEAKLHRKVVTQARDPISIRIETNSGVGEEVIEAEGEETADVAEAAIRTNEAEVMDTLFRLNRNSIRPLLRAQGRFHHHFNLKEAVRLQHRPQVCPHQTSSTCLLPNNTHLINHNSLLGHNFLQCLLFSNKHTRNPFKMDRAGRIWLQLPP